LSTNILVKELNSRLRKPYFAASALTGQNVINIKKNNINDYF